MATETFKITKVPTLEELKNLNWIQFVYKWSKYNERVGETFYHKQCFRYKVLKDGTCKSMILFYWNNAGYDHKMLIDTDSTWRDWEKCSINEIYEHARDKQFEMEANGDKREFASRLAGKRIKKPVRKTKRC